MLGFLVETDTGRTPAPHPGDTPTTPDQPLTTTPSNPKGPISIQSLREVRNHFSEVADLVEREHERVTVTRNGYAAAVILSPEDLVQLEDPSEAGDPLQSATERRLGGWLSSIRSILR